MFYGCTYLEEVIGLDTWDVSNVEDMSFMFNDCKNLKNIGDISGWEINDTKMHGAFYNCKKLKTIGNKGIIKGTRLVINSLEQFVKKV